MRARIVIGCAEGRQNKEVAARLRLGSGDGRQVAPPICRATPAAATSPAEKAEIVGGSLPVAPSPDFIAKNGQRGVVHLNLLEKFEELYADAMLLREFAVNPEAGVKSPLYFGQSIGLRDRLLETALRSADTVWNLRRQRDFYDLVINEIAAASPEVAQTIMEKLRDLNARTGMSFDARA